MEVYCCEFEQIIAPMKHRCEEQRILINEKSSIKQQQQTLLDQV